MLNRKTCASQLLGGVVFGIGMALMDQTLVDRRDGRITGPNMTSYLVPVHGDVPAIETILLDEHEPHVNPAGAKGIGMVGTVGATAAIANAVFHATGRRVRDLPITPEKFLPTALWAPKGVRDE
jgi:xanthine dehydrogenase YagR molybdenum-binding subunit